MKRQRSPVDRDRIPGKRTPCGKRRCLRGMGLMLGAALLLSLAAGCGKTEHQPSVPSVPSVQEPDVPVRLETLAVELPRDYALHDDALLNAVSRLPELLKTALGQAGVEVGTITATVGTSASATCQALSGGTVDLAFLPAEGYVEAGGGGTVILADAGEISRGERWPDALPGTAASLWAGPSDYGRALVQRMENGGALTAEELDHARWGVLDRDSDLGWRYLNLWLADHCEGLTLDDLSQVKAYQSWEELLRAAAEEEIDLLPLTEEALTQWESAWTLERGRTDGEGRGGMGRDLPIREELTAVAALERSLTVLAAVREEEALSGDGFAEALASALDSLSQTGEGRELLTVLGAQHFTRADDGLLNPLRRILTLEGVAL